ncbi:MAG: sigma-70 family RNA polymerase sigma factor [Melioribacteraceae bacterium]|nr:sigma-70 family RNA polymerase sigma factor [Melioribacteraceae bacterium]
MNNKTLKYNLLVKQFKNNIYTYSLYMLRNRMDADDATQEVLIRIWNNIDKFNYSAAKSYIMRITHNLCIDFLRKRNLLINRELEITEDIEESFGDESTESNPYLVMQMKIATQKIKEAIEKLPENLKSVFVLYEMQGMKYIEISKALEIPINNVKVNLFRARKKLQEELKIYESE